MAFATSSSVQQMALVNGALAQRRNSFMGKAPFIQKLTSVKRTAAPTKFTTQALFTRNKVRRLYTTCHSTWVPLSKAGCDIRLCCVMFAHIVNDCADSVNIRCEKVGEAGLFSSNAEYGVTFKAQAIGMLYSTIRISKQ